MARHFIIVLAIAYALIPPGICACRLEAWACSTSAANDPMPNDSDDDDDCGCPRIQHDCVIQTQTAFSSHDLDDGFTLNGAPLATQDSASITTATPLLQVLSPDATPLYLKVRALLI
jgi:hypothetical protein